MTFRPRIGGFSEVPKSLKEKGREVAEGLSIAQTRVISRLSKFHFGLRVSLLNMQPASKVLQEP